MSIFGSFEGILYSRTINVIHDGIQNLVTAAMSSVDPISQNRIVADNCVDRTTWYRNGGIASTIADYWPQLVGSGIKLSWNQDLAGSKLTEVTSLADHLLKRYEELNLESLLIDLHIGIHLKSMSALSIDSIGSSWSSPIRVGAIIKSLTIISKEIDNEYINNMPTGNYIVNHEVVNASRVLVMKGRCIYSDENNNYTNNIEPLVNSSTVDAALLYEQAVKTAATLLQLKSTITMGISGFNDGMRKEQAGEYSKGIIKIIKQLQATNKILNVNLHDKEETGIQVLERSLAQVDAVVDRVRDYLLSTTNNIPETRLFGSSRVGGLSKTNDDDSRTDGEADRIFNSRWKPLIRQLNDLLVKEEGSPSSRLLKELTIGRKSAQKSNDLEVARIRLINAQAAKIEAELGLDAK